MAHIHNTTMSPTKLELLDRWLPQQAWYAGTGKPDLNRVGGFRLDDPDGEVGIEFMVVRDDADGGTAYHVPMTYRGEPLEDAPDSALIGTSEHGVLGERWIYDGAQDPVLVAQLAALLRGAVTAQHQSKSDTAEPRVRIDSTADDTEPAGAETVTAADGTVIHLFRVFGDSGGPEAATGLASFEAETGHGTLSMSGLDVRVRS
ncbi:MAG TPA: 1,4-alpha-glucan branching protein [Mycobacteriales bacterium]|nr:1,4-alpha-glucan branching protein [Mycobacteriales bacterium]